MLGHPAAVRIGFGNRGLGGLDSNPSATTSAIPVLIAARQVFVACTAMFSPAHGGYAPCTGSAISYSKSKLYWSCAVKRLWPLNKPRPCNRLPPITSMAWNFTKYFLVHGGFSTSVGNSASVVPCG